MNQQPPNHLFNHPSICTTTNSLTSDNTFTTSVNSCMMVLASTGRPVPSLTGLSSKSSSTCNRSSTSTTNTNYWFHSYDPKAHEEKKRKLREFSTRNKFKGLHFRPSKYMKDESVVVNGIQDHTRQKKVDERIATNSSQVIINTFERDGMECKQMNSSKQVVNSPIPLTHSFQLSCVKDETLNSLKSNSILLKRQVKMHPPPLLPSINEILSLSNSRIENLSHRMTPNHHMFSINENPIDNLTLPPFKLYL